MKTTMTDQCLVLSSFIFLLVSSLCGAVTENQQYYLHPDTGLNISQLLEKHGYPFESYEVQTQDGYLLALHRVPFGVQNTSTDPNKPVALLVHGMGSQSIDFVNNEPWNSLGLLLADRGYDVWLLNCRGNTHSRRHVHLDPDKDKKKFWDFSWHEVGVYDLPNTIDYILNVTKQEKLFYFGHSQGCTSFWVMCAMLPEYNQKIRHMTALGPSAFMSNNQDIKYRTLAKMYKELELLSTVLGVHEFGGHNDIYLELVKKFCLEGMPTFDDCVKLYYFGIGYSPTEINMTLVPVHVSNSPSGFSVKEGFHYLQSMINGGYFRQYDHGRIMNKLKYGQPTPPDYNLSNIVASITLHYSKEDQLSNYQDVEILASRLSNVKKRMVPTEHFTHLDLIWGNNAKTLIFDYIFEEIENY